MSPPSPHTPLIAGCRPLLRHHPSQAKPSKPSRAFFYSPCRLPWVPTERRVRAQTVLTRLQIPVREQTLPVLSHRLLQGQTDQHAAAAKRSSGRQSVIVSNPLQHFLRFIAPFSRRCARTLFPFQQYEFLSSYCSLFPPACHDFHPVSSSSWGFL